MSNVVRFTPESGQRADISECPQQTFHSDFSRSRASSCRQRVEQGLGLLQIARVEPLGEPAVDRRSGPRRRYNGITRVVHIRLMANQRYKPSPRTPPILG